MVLGIQGAKHFYVKLFPTVFSEIFEFCCNCCCLPLPLRLVLLLCGGNIDTTVLGRCLERGLAVDGRLIKFSATVSDRPGGIAELCALLARLGVSIKDIEHERAWIANDVFSVSVSKTRWLERVAYGIFFQEKLS